jgi:nucleotide-binding universal stress UspA family protein
MMNRQPAANCRLTIFFKSYHHVFGESAMIPEIKKILYATDLSENARYAFGYAVSLADRYNAKISIINVVEELSPFAQSMVEDIVGTEKLQTLQKEKKSKVFESIRQRLDEFCQQTIQEIPECSLVVERTIVESGQPVDAIIHHAEEEDADIIVMGSHGQGMLADVTMGSTSRRVLRRCSRPVLVIRLPENE